MATKTLPDVGLLRQLLEADFDAGTLTWLPRTPDMFDNMKTRSQLWMASQWNSRFANKPAFTSYDAYGYKMGRIYGAAFKAHRVIYAMYHGAWPSGDVDHINGVRDDNRIVNLRNATRSQNLVNAHTRTGRSKYIGVHKPNRSEAWVARISHNNRQIYIGSYANEEEAARARDEFAVMLHGEYASLNFPRGS